MKRSTIIEIISMLFIILFVYTAISKFMDFSVFSEQIATSPILAPVASWIAWVVPIAEILVSIALLIPAFRLKGLYASLALMLGFTIYIILILNFSPHIPCSCGGVIELMSWREHLVFNSFFIVVAILAIWLSRPHIARLSSSNSHS
ncbi:MauE/DoxX family redox-associated membrane protein [Chitinophaga sancti]|uniref:MauE/DoxX family redox-associated membrane protein n=1 Tax=Chitinophaga sancti TaxID=1004 RepID=UPI002A75D174|nr:MauE/DoxX family redox-associated membrane protein [Chitinophaga sancti]WPQ63387.1 MauE/DoxX family redox-associated membrane protein [Chitinophaga sancti]